MSHHFFNCFGTLGEARVVNDNRNLTSYPITIPHVTSIVGSKWTVGVRQYPAFAEYADGKVKNGSSGVSDTGLNVRAFLPIDGQGNRSSIHVYNGPATVVDSRVVCVRPNITNLGARLARLAPYDSFSLPPTPILHGNISIPLDLLQEVSASRLSPLVEPIAEFNCSISYGIAPDNGAKYHPSDWDLSICQLNQRGYSLRNAWMSLDEPLVYVDSMTRSFKNPGPAYLLVNFSSRVKFEYASTDHPMVDYSLIEDIFNDSKPGLVRRTRGDWIDVYRTNNSSTAADATLSFSMCYTASTASYLNVSASSTVPLVQPRYSYDSVDGRIRFDDVRKQMLSSSHTTIEQRGILSLSSQVLSLQPRVLGEEAYMELPYLGNFDMEIAFKVRPFEYAPTINLVQFYEPVTNRADISIGGLLLEVLREGGTPAEAVQSMFTALCASRYEDYVFLNDGNMTYPARSDFVAVQVPGGKGQPVFIAAGPTRSYILVMAAIVVHSLVTIFAIVWFCKGTCFWQQFVTQLTSSIATNSTLLWESWSNISQVISPQTAPYLERAAQATDSEIKAWMKDDGLNDSRTAISTHPAVGEADRALIRRRAQRIVAEQGEAEQGLMMDELASTQSSSIGTQHSTAVSRASSFSPSVARVAGRGRSSLEA